MTQKIAPGWYLDFERPVPMWVYHDGRRFTRHTRPVLRSTDQIMNRTHRPILPPARLTLVQRIRARRRRK
jgi:hypothetical protein